MVKSVTPKTTSSAAATTDLAERLRRWVERLAATLDPDFPSVVVEDGAPAIDEPAAGYEGRPKPDFVKADDAGWDVPGA